MESFNTDRALEDLEKLREQILEARARRQRTEEEFDAFTRRSCVEPVSLETVPSLLPAATIPAQPTDPADTDPDSQLDPMSDADARGTIPDPPRALVRPEPPRRHTGRILAAVGVAGAVLASAAIVAMRHPQEKLPEAARDTPAPASTPEPVVTTAPAAPAAAAPSPAAVAPGVNVEIITRRRVWMRVTLDGERAFEREVAAGQHMPLHAGRSIVIRAGDAGAVAVVRNGRDAGALGRDGVVATREFRVDAASPR